MNVPTIVYRLQLDTLCDGRSWKVFPSSMINYENMMEGLLWLNEQCK